MESTGVYIGIQQMEYGNLAAAHISNMGAFTATGTPFSVAAGRISYTSGFKGPAVRKFSRKLLKIPCIHDVLLPNVCL